MKDLIAKLQMDANCAMGAIWMHIDAQAARIAELEAQIAAGFEPVVGQQPYIYAHKSMFEIRGEHHCIHAYKTADDTFNVPLYLAPQPAGTDKLREAIRNVEISTSGSKGYFKAWNEGAEHMRDAILNLIEVTALQAPVREVPDEEVMVERMRDALAAVLGEAMDCTRVWSAWSYGTMGPDDFHIIAEDDERLDEVARAAVAVFLPEAPVQEPKP